MKCNYRIMQVTKGVILYVQPFDKNESPEPREITFAFSDLCDAINFISNIDNSRVKIK